MSLDGSHDAYLKRVQASSDFKALKADPRLDALLHQAPCCHDPASKQHFREGVEVRP
ncbi:MAG: hypothetical protein QM723_22325 [Myxococcaceae bacterium]